MADLDVLHPILGFFQGHVEPADPVSRVAVDARQTPFGQALPNIFAHVHRKCPVCRPRRRSVEFEFKRETASNVAELKVVFVADRRFGARQGFAAREIVRMRTETAA